MLVIPNALGQSPYHDSFIIRIKHKKLWIESKLFRQRQPAIKYGNVDCVAIDKIPPARLKCECVKRFHGEVGAVKIESRINLPERPGTRRPLGARASQAPEATAKTQR